MQIFPEPRLEHSLADDEEAQVLAAQRQERSLHLDQEADVLFHGKAAYESKLEGAGGSIPLGRVEERCVYAAPHKGAGLAGRFFQQGHELAIRGKE